ncbi:MAG TPA: hypothetical protein VIP98_11525 [Microlunatus sp.]
MTTALLLQTSRWRDAAHDAVLTAAARELDPVRVVAATVDPDRTRRRTGLPAIAADRSTVLRSLHSVDAVILVGGRTLASAASSNHVLGMADVYALSVATRAAGKRFAMIGVAAGPLSTRRDMFFARRLMITSSLAVLDEPSSADLLVAAGVPSPVRVGAHLGWLELQQPPESASAESRDRRPALVGQPDRLPGEDLWFAMTRTGVEARGGAAAVAGQLAAIQAALVERRQAPAGVLVQGWRGGVASGDDLEAVAEVADELRRYAVPVRVVPPAIALAEVRDAISRVALCVTGHPHALMAASAAGVALIAWPHSPASRTLAEWLEVPTLPGSATGAVKDAFDRAGHTLPVVRQQIATAGEVVDLLRVVLTEGGELPRTATAGMAKDHRLRPTGVMR